MRPRISQLELFILVDLLNDRCGSSNTPYNKQLRRLRRKPKRKLKIDRSDFPVKSNRVPYVKPGSVEKYVKWDQNLNLLIINAELSATEVFEGCEE